MVILMAVLIVMVTAIDGDVNEDISSSSKLWMNETDGFRRR